MLPERRVEQSGRLMTLQDSVMTRETTLNAAPTYPLIAESEPVHGLMFVCG